MERNINLDGFTYASEEEAREALRLELIRYAANPGEYEFRDLDDEPERTSVRTVAVATQEFLDERRGLAPKTQTEYESIRRVVVCHPIHGIGSKPISELTSGDLTTWRDVTLPDAGVTPAQAAYGWRFLRSALSWAVEKDRLAANPAKASGSKRRTQEDVRRQLTPSRIKVPTWQQEMDLVLAVPDESRRLLMLLLMRGGARFTEVASIPPANLELEEGKLWMEYQWRKVRGEGWVMRPLKNGHPRYMSAPQQLIERVADYLRNRWEPPRDGRKEVIFPYVGLAGGRPTRGGSGVWTPAEYRRYVMLQARERAGLPTMRIKDLRMSAASNFADAGFSDAQVQEMVGHLPGSPVTGRHYVRPISDNHSQRRAAVRLNTELSQQARLDLLWDAWVRACGNPFMGLPGGHN